MIKLIEIREWLSDLWNLIVDIKITFNNAKRLSAKELINEEKVKKRGFFKHYFFQQKFILAIQLCKILTDNDNQKRNISKFIRRLESESFDNDLIEQLKSNEYVSNRTREGLLQELKMVKEDIIRNQDLIKKIIKVRDENYAHFDPTRSKLGPTLDDYKKAVDLAIDAYNRISLQTIGSAADFDKTGLWDVDGIIKELTENYNRGTEEHQKGNIH